MGNKTLVLLLHPAPDYSQRCVPVIECLRSNPDNTIREIGRLYPGFLMSEEYVAHEQALIKTFNQILFVYPMYWYDMPAFGRFYIEKVFDKGFAYNLDRSPSQTHGLRVFYIYTCAENKVDYTASGACGDDDQIMFIHKDMCKYCGMVYGGCLTIGGDQDIVTEVSRFRATFE